ncbi:hypothetical protein N9F16_00785 [bacterium]|nr:hypothetical protein [bacterium]
MSKFTDYFPSSGGGGGGGGGFSNYRKFITSGTFDITDPYGDGSNLAIPSGNSLSYVLVGGGYIAGGRNYSGYVAGGSGGRINLGLVKISANITVSIGAGGATFTGDRDFQIPGGATFTSGGLIATTAVSDANSFAGGKVGVLSSNSSIPPTFGWSNYSSGGYGSIASNFPFSIITSTNGNMTPSARPGFGDGSWATNSATSVDAGGSGAVLFWW